MNFRLRSLPRRIGLVLAVTLATLCGGLASAQTGPAVEPVTVRAVAHFGFDQAELLPQDRERLLAEVATMTDVSWQTVTAVGHTDAIGTPAYNASLSARRAQAIKSWLVSQGLDGGMIRTDARGPAEPVADNGEAAGRARNRRTEVEFRGVRPAAR